MKTLIALFVTLPLWQLNLVYAQQTSSAPAPKCFGHDKVENFAQLHHYKNQLTKNKKYIKHLVIGSIGQTFNIPNNFHLSSPCSIFIGERVHLQSSHNITFISHRNIFVRRNASISVHNLHLQAQSVVAVEQYGQIKGHDIRLESMSRGTFARAQLHYGSQVDAHNLSVISHKSSKVSAHNQIKLTGRFELISKSSQVKPGFLNRSTILNDTAIEAKDVYIKSYNRLWLARRVSITTDEIYAQAKGCYLNRKAHIQAPVSRQSGNCLDSDSLKVMVKPHSHYVLIPQKIDFDFSDSYGNHTLAGYEIEVEKDGKVLSVLKGKKPHLAYHFTQVGSFKLTFRVFDITGSFDEVTSQIEVAHPIKPIAVLSSDIKEGTIPFKVNFNAHSSHDPQSSQLTFFYRINHGPYQSVDKDFAHLFTAPGIYDITLMVKNSYGLTDYAHMRIQAHEPYHPPKLTSISPTPGTRLKRSPQRPYELKLTFSSPLEVVRVDGQEAKISADGFTATIPLVTRGQGSVYTLPIEYEGLQGDIHEQEVTYAVNHLPVSKFIHKARILVNEATTLDARRSKDFDGAVKSYEWSIGQDKYTTTTPLFIHTFKKAMPTQVTLTVTDQDKEQHSFTDTINVIENAAPQANFAFKALNEQTVPISVVLDGSLSTDDESVKKYIWQVDQREPVSTSSPEFSYRIEGTKASVITLTVFDRHGKSHTMTKTMNPVTTDDITPPKITITPAGGVLDTTKDEVVITLSDDHRINFENITIYINDKEIPAHDITIFPESNQVVLKSTNRNIQNIFEDGFNHLSFSVSDEFGNPSSIEATYDTSSRLDNKRNTRFFNTALGITGNESTCVLVLGGKVHCFGNARMGKLGYGNVDSTTGTDPLASGVVNLSGPAQKVSVYRRNACALLDSGDITCWGENANGLLGQGQNVNQHIGDDDVPSDYPNLNFGAVKFKDIKVGANHVCAQSLADDLYCWGNSSYMNLLGHGIETIVGDNEDPGALGPVPIGEKIHSFDVGFIHTCVVTKSRQVKCFGSDNDHRLGLKVDTYASPVQDMPYLELPEKIKHVSTGVSHSCALSVTNKAYCWGRNLYGALGLGVSENQTPFVLASDSKALPLSNLYKIMATGFITCALFDDGQSKCWGLNDTAQLGIKSLDNQGDNEALSDIPHMDVGGVIEDISSGTNHTCAQFDNGKMKCWGYNDAGSLGYPEIFDNTIYGHEQSVADLSFMKLEGSVVYTGMGTNNLAYFEVDQHVLSVGETITLTGQTIATIQNYEWSFGNGDELETGSASTTYQFTQPGTYKIKLKVRDQYGVVVDIFKRLITVH